MPPQSPASSTAPASDLGTPVPIVVDCDPGHDDAIALLLAAADRRLDLRAITTVAGNQTLPKTTLNARRMCTVAGITGVPLAAGAERPLRRALHVAADIHGESGLDGPSLPEPTIDVVPESAVELTAAVVRGSDRPVTLVALGPLTNVAALLAAYPDARDGIGEIVLMGGSTERGNVTPYAEFNIFVDPEAAARVFDSGIPVRMVGLNVTHQAGVGAAVVERLRAIDTPVATVCEQLMLFFADNYREVFGLSDPPLHDPLAVAAVADPSLLTWRRVPVAIETAGTHTAGATVVDLYHGSGATPNADVAVGVDVDRFFDLVVEAVAAY